MKVLIISGAFPPMPAGEATNAYHLCEKLVERGLDVRVLTTRGNTAVRDSRIVVHDLMSGWSWSEMPRLMRFLKKCQPDVVYFMYLGWMYHFQFMSTFVATIAKRVLPHARFIVRFENVHGAFARYNSIPSRLIRRVASAASSGRDVDYTFGTLLRDSDDVIVLSAHHETFLEERLPGVRKKTLLLPPPSNMRMSPEGQASRDRGRQSLGVGPAEFLVSYIGFVYPGKGIETLLRGFKLIAAAHAQARLVVIGGAIAKQADGTDYFGQMKALAASLGIDRRVIWTGEYAWDSDEASTYLRASDTCVLPFDSGVMLNNSSFSSAAAHGLPIVTTDSGKLESAFVDESNVLLFTPKSPESLARVVARVIEDPSLRVTLGTGSLTLAREWYSWESAVEKTLALFRPVANVSRPARLSVLA